MKFTIMGRQSCPALIQCQHYTPKHQRLPRHSARGVGTYVHMYVCTYVRMYMRMYMVCMCVCMWYVCVYVCAYVCGMYGLQCTCFSNRGRELRHAYNTNILIVLRWHLCRNDYGFCLWIHLPGPWIHNQDYEYLYIQVSCSRLLHSVPLSTFVIKFL